MMSRQSSNFLFINSGGEGDDGRLHPAASAQILKWTFKAWSVYHTND